MGKTKAIEAFHDFYDNFDLNNSALFQSVYDTGVVFEDPFHRIEGRRELYQYFKKMMVQVAHCRFEILDTTLSGGESAVVVWNMYYRHGRLNGGKEIVVNGSTHLGYKEKVYFHRDYFDSSQLLYRHIPVLGAAIRFIERRL